MSGAFRLAEGGRVDRARPLRFAFDGAAYVGCAGDTLASALIANGIHLIGRSFKLHRPRGLLSLGPEEPNAIVSLDAGKGRVTPNVRAAQIELYEGLKASSQNAWPSRQWDALSLVGLFSDFMPAGFYYKTFMQPKGAWARLYEPAIRRAAGLGIAPKDADPDHYAFEYTHCDVAVIGGGPAGLAAALSAARAGARVILFDDQAEFGGSLLAETQARIDGAAASVWLAATLAELAASPRVKLLARTQAFGLYAQNFIGAEQRLTDHLAAPDPGSPRARLWQVRAKRIVLATGAFERPLVFPDNDRPGILLAEAARTLVARYGVKPGARVVVATAHEFGLSNGARSRRGRRRDRDGRRPPADRRRRAAAGGAARRTEGRDPCGDRRRLRNPSRHPRADRQTLGRRRAERRGGDTLRLHCDERRLDGECRAARPGARAHRLRRDGARIFAGEPGRRPALGRRLPRRLLARRRARRRLRGRRRGGRRRAAAAAAGRGRGDRFGRRAGAGDRRGGQAPRQGVRRFPQRRHRARSDAGDARGHALDRARQALHHRRHGRRPGQGDQPQCAGDRRGGARQADRRSRNDDLPSALCAGDLRRARRAFARRCVRADPRDAAARLGGAQGRSVRGRRAVEAGVALSPAGRDGRRNAETRVSGDARQRRRPGRFDARQDRNRRPRRGRVSRTPVRQCVRQAAGWALPLRGDAERGRLRDRRRRRHAAGRGSLPRHHDDRRRRARVRADGGLSADGMARPQGLGDVDHRAICDDRDQRPARARHPRSACRGDRRSRRPLFRI